METFRQLSGHLDLVPAAITRQLSEIDVSRGRQEAFALQFPAGLDALRQTALIQSVEASNAIEDITAPRGRIEAIVAEKVTPQDRSEEEIAGYRDVLATIHANAGGMRLTSNIVLQLHRDLYAYTAQPGGRWKGSDNLVTEARPDGTTVVRFTPVTAFATPAAMDELHQRLDEAWTADHHHRLLLSAAYVLDFLVIHPFLDGNGRMSRLLTLLLLYRGGYDVGRFVSLEALIARSKETYYQALQASTVGWHEGTHDLRPWLSYFLGLLTAAYREFEPQAAMVTSGRGAKSELVKAFVMSGITDTFSFADAKRASPGVSDEYIRQVLRELRDEGVIELAGSGRNAKWRRLLP